MANIHLIDHGNTQLPEGILQGIQQAKILGMLVLPWPANQDPSSVAEPPSFFHLPQATVDFRSG